MTTKVVPVELDNGQQILVEITEELGEIAGGPQQVGVLKQLSGQASKAIDLTIRNVSGLVLQSLDKLAHESRAPQKAVLEFGIKFVGEAAVPTIAKGVTEASLKVTVEWLLGVQEANHEV
jgi:hypothetical protein